MATVTDSDGSPYSFILDHLIRYDSLVEDDFPGNELNYKNDAISGLRARTHALKLS